MIEELKHLIGMVGDLPGAALWVLLGFAVYKLITYLSLTGSVVYVLKLAIEKLYGVLMKPKDVNVKDLFWCDNETANQLGIQIARLKDDSGYLYYRHVEWLRQAINEKKAREADDD